MSLTERTIVEVGNETSYAVAANDEVALPFRDLRNPVEALFEEGVHQNDTRDLSDVGLDVQTTAYRWPTLVHPMTAGTPWNVPPSWTRLLPACGFREIVDFVEPRVWHGPFDEAGSVRLRGYLDSRRVVSAGARGGFELAALPGEPIYLRFEMTGLYQDSTIVANPATTTTFSFPPKWCGMLDGWPAFSFWPAGAPSFTAPITKAVNISCLSSIALRFPSRANGQASRVEIAPSDYRWRALIEVNENDDWIATARIGTKYLLVLALQHGNGGWLVSSTGFTAVLTGSIGPSYQDSGGFRCWQLEWRLQRATDGSAVTLQHFGTA